MGYPGAGFLNKFHFAGINMDTMGGNGFWAE